MCIFGAKSSRFLKLLRLSLCAGPGRSGDLAVHRIHAVGGPNTGSSLAVPDREVRPVDSESLQDFKGGADERGTHNRFVGDRKISLPKDGFPLPSWSSLLGTFHKQWSSQSSVVFRRSEGQSASNRDTTERVKDLRR